MGEGGSQRADIECRSPPWQHQGYHIPCTLTLTCWAPALDQELAFNAQVTTAFVDSGRLTLSRPTTHCLHSTHPQAQTETKTKTDPETEWNGDGKASIPVHHPALLGQVSIQQNSNLPSSAWVLDRLPIAGRHACSTPATPLLKQDRV